MSVQSIAWKHSIRGNVCLWSDLLRHVGHTDMEKLVVLTVRCKFQLARIVYINCFDLLSLLCVLYMYSTLLHMFKYVCICALIT